MKSHGINEVSSRWGVPRCYIRYNAETQVVLSRTNNGNIVEFVILAQLNKLGSI